MTDLDYDAAASELAALKDMPRGIDREARRAIIDSEVQLDQAVSLAIIAAALERLAPGPIKLGGTATINEESDPLGLAPQHTWLVGDRVEIDGFGGDDGYIWLIDDLAIREGEPAAYLVSDQDGDLTALWVFVAYLIYVDHPRDGRHDEDGDLQGIDPAPAGVEVSGVGVLGEPVEDDPDVDFDDGFAKAQAKAKSKGKKR